MKRILQLLLALTLLFSGLALFLGDLLVLLHLRPLPDDGFFGLMVGPILALVGAFLTWQSASTFGLVKPISIKPKS